MLVQGLRLEGFSLGGVETCVMLPDWGLAIDVGRAPRGLLSMSHLALTHAHLDHAGGLVYHLALRQLYGNPPPTLYAPAQIALQLEEAIRAWDKLQRFESKYRLLPVEVGSRFPLRRDVELVPFRTHHVVPSFGYSVVETRRKLKPELSGVPGPELAARKARGEAITDDLRLTCVSVTGDTLVEVVESQPQILESDLLVLECTFLDARKRLEDSRAGGHVHLDELWPRASRLAPRALMLSHFSQIYRTPEIDALLAPLAAEIPGELWALPTAEGEAPRRIT
jgi:ribonuclease Z